MITTDTLPGALDRIHRVPRAHFIGGAFVAADKASGTATVLNPANEESLGTVPRGTAADVDASVGSARRAFEDWGRRTPAARAAVLHEIADVIDANVDLLAAIEAINVGKPLAAASEEIPVVSDCLRFMAGAARTAQAPAAGQYVAEHLSYIRREPVGVVGAVVPWNYPLMMAAWKIAPILAAGNTIVLKPSELTPLSVLVLTELVADIVPPGVLNIVLGQGSVVGEALSRHPGIDMVALTGSTRAGQSVAAGAAETVKRLHLELGGKAPVVVFDDADLDAAVTGIVGAGYVNAGQECGAATRVLCHDSVRDDLVERLVNAAEALTMGDPAKDPSVDLGPVISAAQRARVAAMVERAVRDGAVVATGGYVAEGPGFFYPPTVLTYVAPGSEMAREEVFGPVVSVETFSTESEAVAKANDVVYGLAASVWTKDHGRALRVVERLDFGSVWTNAHLVFSSEMPWVGFGQSGYGRDNSTYALEDYTRTKHVTLAMGTPES